MQQPYTRQQTKFGDIQMLQRQIMFKQLQELQRRQQLQDLDDARKQNYLNQLSSLKQISGNQFAPLINGMPIQDSSQLLSAGNFHLMQHGGPPALQRLPNGLVPSDAQNQVMRSVPFPQPQFDVSLYGTPAAIADNNSNPYIHFQGPSDYSSNLLAKNNISEMPSSMQPSIFGTAFMSQHSNSPDQGSTSGGIMVPKQTYQEKNMFGEIPLQGFNSAALTGNYYSNQVNALQRNSSVPESDERQEQAGWSATSQEDVSNPRNSEPVVSLDPLEQKILYNTDDTSWESCIGRRNSVGTGGFQNTLEHNADVFPSIQSGSWSALMQSAVAETSSGDTGLQEEWSGLSFQNPEPSSENQLSIYNNSGKQQNNWVDGNLQNVSSPCSKPELSLQHCAVSSGLPGLQQSGHQYLKQGEGSHMESLHAPIQPSPQSTSHWSNYNTQQKQPMEGSQVIEPSALPNVWRGRHPEHSKNDGHQSNISPYADSSQSLPGHEQRDNTWLPGNMPQPITDSSQKPLDEENPSNTRTESGRTAPSNVESMSALYGASSGLQNQIGTVQPSESMLDLLNKDDISIEHSIVLHSNNSTPDEVLHAKPSAASVAKSYNPPFASQGFGLRLGPPAQWIPRSQPSVHSPPTGNLNTTFLSSSYLNGDLQNQHPPVAVATQTPQAKPIDLASKYPAYGAATSQVISPQMRFKPPSQEFPILETVPVTHTSASPTVSNQMVSPVGSPNVWSDISSRKHFPPSKPSEAPFSLLASPDSTSSSLDPTTGALHEKHNLNSLKSENSLHESGKVSRRLDHCDTREQPLDGGNFDQSDPSGLINTNSLSRLMHRQPSLPKHQTEGSILSASFITHIPQQRDQSSAVAARDIGALGHHLRPLQHLQQSYPHPQEQATADAMDSASPSGTNKMCHVSVEAREDQSGIVVPQTLLRDSQNRVPFGRHVDGASYRTHQSQINLQMAPSWFKHYGTLKNVPVLPMYNSNDAASSAQQFPGKIFENALVNSVTAAPSASNQQFLTPDALLSRVTHQNQDVLRPKKRKIATEFLPWHKLVTECSLRFPTLSTAELEWAQASNRIVEEVKDEVDIFDDIHPVVRAKRRLILTTQLMQQVFKPAPEVILSEDAKSNFDSIAYYAARSALGDAWGLTSKSHLPSDPADASHEKLKDPTRKNSPDYSNAVRGFIDRLKRLEDQLSILDKNVSVVDVRVDSQDLEKFSIINRFAKFHSRAQLGMVGPTTSDGTTPSKQNIFLQRYVIALPMPRSVPEGTNCIPL